MPNQIQKAIESLSRLSRDETVAPVSADVAAKTMPSVCPVCQTKGPFEHVGEDFLCQRYTHVFRVDAKGALVRWWATQNSLPRSS